MRCRHHGIDADLLLLLLFPVRGVVRGRVEGVLQPPHRLLLRERRISGVDLWQEDAHHPLKESGVLPENMKCLIEELVLVLTVHENSVQGPVEIAAVADPDGHHRVGRVDDLAGADRHARGAQNAPEMHDVWSEPVALELVEKLEARQAL